MPFLSWEEPERLLGYELLSAGWAWLVLIWKMVFKNETAVVVIRGGEGFL